MMLTGLFSFLFFLISNFTNFFKGSSIVSGIIQVLLNVFVIVVCINALPHSRGIKKFFAYYGILIPLTLALITVVRVFMFPVLKIS